MTLVAKVTRSRARELRGNLTDAEQRLWRHLRGQVFSDAKFRRQHPVGPYILDFYCAAHRLAIEIDGDQHAEPAAIEHDRRRSQYLQRKQIRVLRFSAREAMGQTEAVLESILAALTPSTSLKAGLPSPTDAGEGGRGACVQTGEFRG